MAPATQVAARVSAALSAARGKHGEREQNPFASLTDETTVELDAAALEVVLSRSSDDGLEETRTYQIPEELLAIARGDDDSSLPIELRRRGRSSSSPPPVLRWWGSRRLVICAHVLVSISALGLAYLMVHLL
jgi:hypothetical protein